MATLNITLASGNTEVVELDQDSFVIGRSSHCDIVLADASLSRRHARLSCEDGVWLVEDLGSRNGTFVNGVRVEQPTAVRPGDVIGVSAVTARLDITEESSDSDAVSIFKPASDVLADSDKITPRLRCGDQDSLCRYAERMRILNEVHVALAGPITLDELLELILDRSFNHLQPEQGVILLRDGDGFRQAKARTTVGSDRTMLTSRALVREVAENGQAALVTDARTDARFADAQSIVGAGVRSLVAAPLLDPEGAIGMIALTSAAAVRQFTEEDMELLVCLASVATMRIRNVALTEEAIERRRLERELALARRIQVALLPSTMPELPGYQILGRNRPSQTVSGDYYQVLERRDGSECVLLIADVSGKGIAAALLTGYMEALSTAPIEDGGDPAEVFTWLSQRLLARTPAERYATAVLISLDVDRGTLRYANAGHTPPFILRRGGAIDWFTTTGYPLGLVASATYSACEALLEPGDLLVLYTDGFTEADNDQREEYGRDRLAAVCREYRDRGLEELAAALEQDLEAFSAGVPFADDRTLLLVRRRAAELHSFQQLAEQQGESEGG